MGVAVRRSHWVMGAGQPGCLYDYGPNAHRSKRDAIADAAWLLGELEGVTGRDIRRMRSDLHRYGIHYFPERVRLLQGHAYVEISKQNGPMPEGDDE